MIRTTCIIDNDFGQTIADRLAALPISLHIQKPSDKIQPFDICIISVKDFATLRSLLPVLLPDVSADSTIINYTAVTMEQTRELKEMLKDSPVRFVAGAVVCHHDAIGTEDALIYYSGDQKGYEAAGILLSRLGGAQYLGTNIAESALMDYTADGIHYSYILAFYTGIALCKKYGFPVETFLYHTLKSMPPLSEAAYRNIWIGLDDPRSFEEVDDVIHGMEMLVCLLKKTGGKEEIRYQSERQKKLNDALYQHWNDLMQDYSQPKD